MGIMSYFTRKFFFFFFLFFFSICNLAAPWSFLDHFRGESHVIDVNHSIQFGIIQFDSHWEPLNDFGSLKSAEIEPGTFRFLNNALEH